MSDRERLRMTDDEVAAFLGEHRRVQIATTDPDGWPHLVPLTYTFLDDRMALWTDGRSRKVTNLRRDDRLTCVVEAGDRFDEYRAVQIRGRAEIIDDLATSERVGVSLYERAVSPLPPPIRDQAIAMAPQRVVVVVHPVKVVSWDHRKLAGARPADIGR